MAPKNNLTVHHARCHSSKRKQFNLKTSCFRSHSVCFADYCNIRVVVYEVDCFWWNAGDIQNEGGETPGFLARRGWVGLIFNCFSTRYCRTTTLVLFLKLHMPFQRYNRGYIENYEVIALQTVKFYIFTKIGFIRYRPTWYATNLTSKLNPLLWK